MSSTKDDEQKRFTTGDYVWALTCASSMVLFAYTTVIWLGVDVPWAFEKNSYYTFIIKFLSLLVLSLCLMFFPERCIEPNQAYDKEVHLTDNNFETISTETGEIIHSVGNGLITKELKIGTLTSEDGRILQELGHALRVRFPRDIESAHEFPVLKSHSFNPGNYSKTQLAAIASRIIGNAGIVSFAEAFEKECGTTHGVK